MVHVHVEVLVLMVLLTALPVELEELLTTLDVAAVTEAVASVATPVAFAATLLLLETAIEVVLVVETPSPFEPLLVETGLGLPEVEFPVAKTVTVTVPFAAAVLFAVPLKPVAEAIKVLVALPAVVVMKILGEAELVALAVTLDGGLGSC